jgi:hypothetical protein
MPWVRLTSACLRLPRLKVITKWSMAGRLYIGAESFVSLIVQVAMCNKLSFEFGTYTCHPDYCHPDTAPRRYLGHTTIMTLAADILHVPK